MTAFPDSIIEKYCASVFKDSQPGDLVNCSQLNEIISLLDEKDPGGRWYDFKARKLDDDITEAQRQFLESMIIFYD